MSIEALKEQARRHEQKEEWQKALDQYKKAITKLERDDQPDIGLYNRVGDLYVRVGNLDEAVNAYHRASDLYVEAELPNNAIAVCKKIIRNVPSRHEAYLRMGQIRALQGFIPDARVNFLTYAERMQQAGNLEESFRALVEFCDLAPEEIDVRQTVAEQMASNGLTTEAVEQFTLTYRFLAEKGDGRASDVEARIRELDPGADLAVAAPPAFEEAAFEMGSGVMDGADAVATYGDIQIDAPTEIPPEAADLATGGVELPAFEAAEEEEAAPLPTFDVGEEEAAPLPMLEPEEEEEAAPLPTFDLGEEEATPLPTFDVGEEEAEPLPFLEAEAEEEAAPLPTFDLGEEGAEPLPTFDLGEEEAEPLPTFDLVGEEPAVPAAVEEDTVEAVRARIQEAPEDVDLRQRLVELAYNSGEEALLVEAFMGLGETLQRAGLAARAKTAFQQVLTFAPDHEGAKAALGGAPKPGKPVKEVAAHEDYVDLGSLILGDEEEKTTRFVVAYEEPSGDEAADFAKMLSQFKEKVSQNLDADDVRAHHDLGTAYKEMGLLDEAVSEFQQALRASANHLPTYEMLGQTFMEMGKPDAAIRSLERALDVEFEIEDELIAIYYYLARAYEEVGNKESALEFYDRVFSLDINFADVTERLRALR